MLFTLISAIPLLVKVQEYPNQSLRFLSIARNMLLKQIIKYLLYIFISIVIFCYF